MGYCNHDGDGFALDVLWQEFKLGANRRGSGFVVCGQAAEDELLVLLGGRGDGLTQTVSPLRPELAPNPVHIPDPGDGPDLADVHTTAPSECHTNPPSLTSNASTPPSPATSPVPWRGFSFPADHAQGRSTATVRRPRSAPVCASASGTRATPVRTAPESPSRPASRCSRCRACSATRDPRPTPPPCAADRPTTPHRC